jgi:hypothetical protein
VAVADLVMHRHLRASARRARRRVLLEQRHEERDDLLPTSLGQPAPRREAWACLQQIQLDPLLATTRNKRGTSGLFRQKLTE